MRCVTHPVAQVGGLMWRENIRRKALADGLRMNLQIESVSSSNPVHRLQLVGVIQCDNSPGKSL